MFRFAMIALLTVNAVYLNANDQRPAFDKSAYKNTMWTQANPWFPPNMDRVFRAGGPDYAMKRYPANAVDMWAEVAKVAKSYGLTGIQMEVMIHVPPDTGTLKNMLEGFKRAGNDFKLAFMISPWGNAQQFAEFFDLMADELANHPNVYRLGGRPVITLYQDRAINKTPPEQWQKWFKPVEDKHGPMIFLIDAAFAEPGSVEKILPYVDGITMYGNWSIAMQRDLFKHVVPVMKNKYPDKIFEAAVHATYLSHFSGGGVRPRLLDKYLASWNMTAAAKPDAIVLTNFFDIYENSRVLPSYELEDVLLKTAKARMADFAGQKLPGDNQPDFRLVNFTGILIGQDAAFDVVGFPVNLVNKNFELTLELLAPNGNVVHTFPKFSLNLEKLAVGRNNLSTLTLAEHYALIPRLSWQQSGGTIRGSMTGMPTNLVSSMLPHRLFWSRGSQNRLAMKSVAPWSLNGCGTGEMAQYPADGVGVILSNSIQEAPWYHQRTDTAGDHVRIMRNGLELTSFSKRDLNLAMPVHLPDPGGSIDYYHLELENRHGVRFTTQPVYLTANRRPGKVTVPVLTTGNRIASAQIDAARIPFFYYPGNEFTGNLWRDQSGYEHHGHVNARWDGGKLATTGYHYEHLGIPGSGDPAGDPSFERDADGSGFRRFKGAGFVAMMGGTAFPYASTWEMELRIPEARQQAILSTIQNQLNIAMSSDGYLTVSRSNPSSKQSAVLKSKAPFPLGAWTKLTVVYDMAKLRFYLNGELQSEAAIPPDRAHEDLNSVYFGARARFPHGCLEPYYQGDLRNLRLYGRNLSMEEWL